MSAFEGGTFAIAKWSGGATVVFKLEPRAVVGSEDEVGVLIELQLAEEVDEAADFVVDVFDDIGVGVGGIGVADVIGHIERNVRHGVGEVEEEGLVLVGLDEVHGLLGVATGDGALVNGEFDDFFVLHEGRFPLGESGLGIGPKFVHSGRSTLGFPFVVRVIHVVGVGNAEVGIEAVLLREGFGVMAEVPFSEAGGGVALSFEVIGDGVLGRVEPAGGGGEENVLVHFDPLGIAAGEEGGTGRGADGGGHHETGKFASFFGEAIDVGGLDVGGAKAPEVAVALVVGEDDDEVWLFSGPGQEAQ